jgi:hypothetical protein
MGSAFAPAGSPPPPPPLPPAAIPPTMANAAVQGAGNRQMSQAAKAAGKGFDDTLKTGPEGALMPPATAKTSLG